MQNNKSIIQTQNKLKEGGMYWNNKEEPISERLRNSQELLGVITEKSLMYNPNSKETAIIAEVYEVFYDKDDVRFTDEKEEDRFVEYITQSGPRQDFSVDLDDEGWLWQTELKELT